MSKRKQNGKKTEPRSVSWHHAHDPYATNVAQLYFQAFFPFFFFLTFKMLSAFTILPSSKLPPHPFGKFIITTHLTSPFFQCWNRPNWHSDGDPHGHGRGERWRLPPLVADFLASPSCFPCLCQCCQLILHYSNKLLKQIEKKMVNNAAWDN